MTDGRTFVHRPGPLVCAGLEALGDLSARLGELDASRIFVLTSPSIARTPDVLRRLERALGDRLAGTFTDVVPFSPTPVVEEAARRARAAGADGLVALGGGSVQDSTKGVAVLLSGEARLEDCAVRTVEGRPTAPKALRVRTPIVALPTTLSAAEMLGSASFVDPDTSRKMSLDDPALVPRVVLLDPHVSRSTPPQMFLASGLNALDHCVEALYTRFHQPIADGLALQGARLLGGGLAALGRDPDDLAARLTAHVGAAASGLAYGSTQVAINHAMCGALGGRLRVAHALANAVMLPHGMRFNLDCAAEALARFGEACGAGGTGSVGARAEAAIVWADRLRGQLGLPSRLRDIGVPREALPAVAEDAFRHRQTYYNPRPVREPAEILAMLEHAW